MNVFYNVRVVACTDRDVKEEVYITCKKIKKKPKETHIKYNHCQMTHTTVLELKLIDKKKPILNIITDK